MDSIRDLTRYLQRVERRLRAFVWIRGIALVAVAAGLATILLSASFAQSGLTPRTLSWSRIVLIVAIVIAAVVFLKVPLGTLRRRLVLEEIERRFPAFGLGLITFTERQHEPFAPLLAEKLLDLAKDAPPAGFVRRASLWRFVLLGLGAGAALASLVVMGAGSIGHNARVIWRGGGQFKVEVVPPRQIVCRGLDLQVKARVHGFVPQSVELWVRDSWSSLWKARPMSLNPDHPEFVGEISDLQEGTEFVVEADGVNSLRSTVRVVDLPRVQQIAVTYPGSVAERSTGDIAAWIGTKVNIEIRTIRPLPNGRLVFDNEKPLDLPATAENRTSVQLSVGWQGRYRVSVPYEGQLVPVSPEYDIVPMEKMPYRKGLPLDDLKDARSDSAPVAPGYEQAVREYYKRLNEAKKSDR